VDLPTLKKLLVVSLQLVSPGDSDASHHVESSEGQRWVPVKQKAVAVALEAAALEYQDITDVTDDSDDEARRGEAVARKSQKDKIREMGKLAKRRRWRLKAVIKSPKEKKPWKARNIAVTTIPQIAEHMDELAEWIRGYEFLYRQGHKEYLDLKKKMILYNEKAKEMMEARPDLGEVTGKYHDCVECCESYSHRSLLKVCNCKIVSIVGYLFDNDVVIECC